jgi:YD repeat-containing protein
MKKYKYTGDYDLVGPSSGAPDLMVLKSMRTQNMIGYLSEEQEFIKESGNWNLLSGKVIKYRLVGIEQMSIQPQEEYILETNAPLANATISELLGPGILNIDSHYKKRITYNNYDSFGNRIFISKDDADNTVYLWSYKGKYPIAEIKNATYTEVKAALNYNDAQMDALTKQDSPNVANIDAQLRTYFINKTALVTTYTYKPLVGTLTAKDPRGVVTTYEYDSFGRLKSTSLDGKIVEGYDYNYKQ